MFVKQNKFLKNLIKIFFILSVIFLIVFLTYYLVVTNNVGLSYEKLPLSYNNIQIFDNQNNDISSLYFSNLVTKDTIPNNIKLAFLITEDREFYNHKGINYKRLLGALINNIKNGDLSQGGSTITQQLVKNTHLTQDKNLERKIKEFKIAKQIEKNFTKDEILSMYLNILYFGKGIYGISNASKAFFNKDIQNVNLAEACMLAGVVKNPSKYSPLINEQNAKKRQELILNILYKNNKINKEVLNNQLNYIIKITNTPINDNFLNSYLVNAIYEVKSILNINNNSKLPKNIKIYLNIDTKVQKHVFNIVNNKISIIKNENGNYPDNSIIVLDNNQSKVIAFSSNYKDNLFNVKRQIGSLAKPFVSYLPALENNLINVVTPILDEKIDINGYSPNNYNNIFHGYTNMRESLMHSYNVPAVKVLNMVGVEKSKEFIKKLNLSFNEKDNLAMALGGFTDGENLLNIAGCYSMLANNGTYTKPSFINKIIIDNNEIYNKFEKSQVASNANSYIITDCLKSVVKDGTLKKLSYLPYDIAGKTGTVASINGNSDAYSACYTTNHTIVSWQGNLSNKKEYNLPNNVTGGSYPTNQIYNLLNKLYSTSYPNNFIKPNTIINKDVDLYEIKTNHNVVLADENMPKELVINEIFNINNVPNNKSTFFDKLNDINISYINNYNNIKFNIMSDNIVNFEIYKSNIFNNKLITNIENNNDITNILDDNNRILIEFIDDKNNKIIKYNYIIKPYIIIKNNEKYYLDEIFIKIK